MSFRKNLEHLRKGKNFSQEDLAYKLGVSRQAVSKWESGGTYPETSKMLAMCKLFECSLDDLMQEDIAEIQKEAKKKYTVDDLIGEITGLITRTSTMISRMTFRSLVKFGFELFMLFIIMLILKIPFDNAYGLGEGVFVNFGYKVGTLLSSIWRLIVEGVYFISATILFVYIYKIRFLDKFDAGEQQTRLPKKVEKDSQTSDSQKTEIAPALKSVDSKIPTDFGLFGLLGKFAILSVKAFVILMFPLLVMALIGSLAGLVIGASWLINGIVYIGALLFAFAFAFFCALMIYVSFNFVLDRRLGWEKVFVLFLASIMILGISVGIGTLELNKLTITTENRPALDYEVLTQEFEMRDNLDLSQFWFRSESVVDNTLNDKVRVEIIYDKDFSEASIGQYNQQLSAYVYTDTIAIGEVYKLFFDDLKTGKLYVNYGEAFDGRIKVYANDSNLKKIEDNVIAIQTLFEDTYDECECSADSVPESTIDTDDSSIAE